MATQQMNPTMGDRLGGIATMDFSKVELKPMDTEEGKGWSVDQCEGVEREYRRCLVLSRWAAPRKLIQEKC